MQEKYKEILANLIIWASLIGIVLLILTGPVLFCAYQEAKTFNKFTDSEVKATWWDALFSDLRVEAREK